jgi:hypothetical protein
LPQGSAPRIRTLAKFVENDYAKIVRVLEIRKGYSTKLGKVEAEIEDQRKGLDQDEIEEMAEEWLSKRLDAGLFAIQMTDLILAWLCTEDQGAKKKIAASLNTDQIRKTLQGMLLLPGTLVSSGMLTINYRIYYTHGRRRSRRRSGAHKGYANSADNLCIIFYFLIVFGNSVQHIHRCFSLCQL